MESAARELAEKKVRVLNIAPGPIITSSNQFALDDSEQKDAVESEIPLGRMGNAEEIAAAVAWAASDQASYVTERRSWSTAACRFTPSSCELARDPHRSDSRHHNPKIPGRIR